MGYGCPLALKLWTDGVKVVTLPFSYAFNFSMKQYSRIFQYLGDYKGKIFLYFLFTLLSIVFSIVSIGMLMPFLELIFTNPRPECADCGTLGKVSNNGIVQYIKDYVQGSVSSGKKTETLGFVCLLMILFILLKNLFLYLSYYILSPLKNKVVNGIFE